MAGGTWIGAYVIGGAVVYGLIASHLSKKRNQSGRCARCGVALDASNFESDIPFDGDVGPDAIRVTMCPRCAETTARNYRAIYYLFVIGGIIGILGGVLSIASVLAAKHLHGSELWSALFMVVSGAVILCYSKTIRTWLKARRTVPSSDQNGREDV